jgi:hypothetical protein
LNKLFKTIRIYAAILTILGVVIVGTKFYYGLYMNIEHAFVQINRIDNIVDKLDMNLDKLTIEVAVLKNSLQKR